MKRALKILFTVFLALFGILFTTVMRKFAFQLSGNGMGARLFQFLVTGPENICLIAWPLLFPFLPWTRHPRIAIAVFSLSVMPLLWATILLTGEGLQDDAVKNIWKQARPVIYIFGTLFVFPSLAGLAISTPQLIRTLTRKPANQ